ncbi:EAL domain-containing protein [Vibrio sp. 10N.261.46.E11]|uniref:bifunctional diguanylate cyclase/phosphodiesterase n=1 Tax=Vibrio sp. 10N.261.46.E11 TaxID=3229662 RepID=UPI00354B174C
MCLSLWFIELATKIEEKEKKQLVNQVAIIQASGLEKVLHTALTASTQMLAIELIQNEGNFNHFEEYAQEVLLFSSVITNLQLAPNGIIQKIYPLQGHEKAIGHNLLLDESRRKEAFLAAQSNKLTLAGPFSLKQGGEAIVARRPVNLKKQNEEVFWGFANALIMLDDLIEQSSLTTLKDKQLHFQLSRLHPDTGKNDIFRGQPIPENWLTSTATIKVPNTEWALTIGLDPNTHGFSSITLKLLLALIICSLLSYCFLYYAMLPRKLQNAVDLKTEQLHHLANTDMLTGLHNRRKFNKRLDEIIVEVEDKKVSYTLFYFDVDNFKEINDQFGHFVGDQVLKEISRRLNTHFTYADTITRISGDEFALLTVCQSESQVNKTANKLINQLSASWSYLNQTINLSVSMGVVQIPLDGDNSELIMKNVDFAMYQAKHNGRNQFNIFNQETRKKEAEKSKLFNDLQSAITNKEFVLHYQPIYNINTQYIDFYEALVRWQHPTHGLLYPDRFIQMAEQSGLISDIGYCVLEEVCSLIAQLPNEEKPVISINLSACQLKDENIYDRIISILESHKVNPQNIKLEITETTLMHNLQQCSDLLLRFQQLGMSVAIDDFGTGYSSLAILKDLPANYLKIDKSFIDNIHTNKGDRKVAHSIINLAHNLEMKVVAEGIETLDQEQLLQEYQCDLGQGYLFGRPTPFKHGNA